MIEVISSISLWELSKHCAQWIRNLIRAREGRQQSSEKALRMVIIAARETRVYIRQMKDLKGRDHRIECQLTRCWSELGFALSDLKLFDLAARCQLKGEYWADPERKDWVYLQKVDFSLDKMEEQAQTILKNIDKRFPLS